MNPRRFPLLGLALLVLPVLVTAAPLRVLYFSKSSGWEHDVVKRLNGQSSYTEKLLAELGPKHDLEFTFSKDGSLFAPDYLAKFDVVMFYTSGDLLTVGTDGHPAMTPAGKQALLDFVAGGRGIVVVHSGSDTFHTGEKGGGNPPIRIQRFRNYGDAADDYIKLLGGEFMRHGPQQVAKARVIDPAFPGCAELGAAVECLEEWYSLKEFAMDLHVLLVLETAGMEGIDYQRPSFPLAWARPQGKGRVWFNAMGHREDVWTNPEFQAMLVGGIEWTGGRKSADIAPNLKRVAPDAMTLQPFEAPQ